MELSNKVLVIGLGKLGLPLVACLADSGYDVIGVDKNTDLLAKLSNRLCPIYEPGLKELLDKNWERIKFTDSYSTIVGSQVVFVIVPTPSLHNNRFDMKYVSEAVKSISSVVGKDYMVVDIVSTVLPGDMKQYVTSELGDKCGVCYNPEFIALGNVIKGILEPDFVMIGQGDEKAGRIVEEIYKKVVRNNAPIVRTSIENAELAKISLNVFVTMKIAYAEMLAVVCDKLPGCDVDEVTRLVGTDSRIGKKYLKAGLPYGGPCFPRDNKAFSAVANSLYEEGVAPSILSEATDDANETLLYIIQDKIYDILGGFQGKVISFLGMTYKPDTNVLEQSGAIKLAELLHDCGAKVRLYDPSDAKIDETGGWNRYDSVVECIKDSQLVVIATPWDEFKQLTPKIFTSHMLTPIVLDCWRIYDEKAFKATGVQYYCIGRYDQSHS